MRRLAAVSLVAGCLALPDVSRAEDPAKADLSGPDRWQVGDTVTRTIKLDLEVAVHRGGPGYSSSDTNLVATTVATWVERCEEASPEGQAVKARVHVREWTVTRGPKQKDESLAGRFVVVTREPGEPGFEVEGEGQVSPQARAWIERHLVKEEGAWSALENVLPKEPVAVGESWDPDFVALANALLHPSSDADPEKSKGKPTLASVGPPAVLEGRLEIQTKNHPSGPTTLPWTEGGVLVLEIRGTVGAEERLRARSETWKAALEGKALVEEDPAKGDKLFEKMKIETRFEATRVPGGELPAPPADGTAPPPR
jgi:hypothetical protein